MKEVEPDTALPRDSDSFEEMVRDYRSRIVRVRSLQSRMNWVLLICVLAFFVGAGVVAVLATDSDTYAWPVSVAFALGAYGFTYRLAGSISRAILDAVKQAIDDGNVPMAELIACNLQRGVWQRHLADASWYYSFFEERPSLRELYAEYQPVIRKIRYDM